MSHAMKQSNFSLERILQALLQVEGGTLVVEEVCRELGITEGRFYRCKMHDGLDIGQLRELRALRDESAKLRRVVGDHVLRKSILKQAIEK
jgi:hypothetical protein